MKPPIDKLRKDFIAGQIDRRDFMRSAIAMGLTVTAATAMADKAEAATPKKGGTFRQGLTGGATSDSLDPASFLDSYMINVGMGQLRNCMTEIGPDNQLRGELAESWEASPDAAEWRFNIRQGVEFHNGKTLEAADVAASIQHHIGPDSQSGAKGILQDISEITTDGKNVVVMKLANGSADFPYLLSDYHLGICPANDDGTMDWQSGVGTGGYVLESFEPGIRTSTTRNPNYWKENSAYFDSIETLLISDTTARTNSMMTGTIDGMQNVDLTTIDLMKRNPNVNIFPTTGNQHATLPMFTNTAPFDNNDVRLALKYSLDRQEWLDKILNGYGEIGNDIPIGPANQFRATADEIPQREYDPDKAKFHLKKAGMEDLTVQISASNTAFAGAIDAAVIFAERAKVAGITIDVVREPDDGYWSNVWMKKPWLMSYWGGRPTEDWMFSQVYRAGADWNETFWEHERFNKLLIEGKTELDQTKRREIYIEMQRIVHDEGGALIPLFMAYTQAVSKKVGLPEQIASNWGFDGEKNAERWWFA
ncbi:MAG: ABC transporter substrate-binding protein [Pseudomonadota bacterium]